MSTSQKTEDVSNSAQPGGVPGTPSNLPRSTIKPLGAVGSGAGSSRRTESMAFETSRSVRQVKMPRGSIKRISAAVLLDQDFVWQGAGKQRKHVLSPPSPDRIKAIHDIVAGVLGIQTERGDQVVIESLPFEQTLAQEEAADDVAGAKPANVAAQPPVAKLLADRRVQIGAGIAVLLLIGAVVFFLKRRKKGTVDLPSAALPPGADAETPALIEKPADGKMPDDLSASPMLTSPERTLPEIRLPEMDSATKVMLSQVLEHVSKDPAFAASIVRGWMEEE
jgi:flagellar M-ring protein FliF